MHSVFVKLIPAQTSNLLVASLDNHALSNFGVGVICGRSVSSFLSIGCNACYKQAITPVTPTGFQHNESMLGSSASSGANATECEQSPCIARLTISNMKCMS